MNRLIRIYTACHVGIDVWLKHLFVTKDESKFRDERVHSENSGVKGWKLKTIGVSSILAWLASFGQSGIISDPRLNIQKPRNKLSDHKTPKMINCTADK